MPLRRVSFAVLVLASIVLFPAAALAQSLLLEVRSQGRLFLTKTAELADENEVHDPVLHLKEVLMFTHYMPAHWKNRLHSNEVRSEFSAMYQMKILIFVEEILSLIVAP